MPVDPNSEIEVTALKWAPESVHGLVKDLRIRWALEEAGLDYRVRLVGADKPDGYLKDQPFNQVPCFRDSAVRIFESGAIVQYIGETSEALLPRDPQGRYAAIQWTCAALNSVEPFIQYRALLDSVWAAEDWAEPSKPTWDRLARLRLRQLSDHLADKQWLAGERFTIGDLMMVTVLRIAERGRLLASYPILAAYVKRGEARAAFQQALSDQLAGFREHEPQGAAA